ncbi:type III pantothenate kinase [Tepidiphilus olei]|uniref:type III pantothenate kinase n=1 Tax=Tepidiphilus olei TaxID=2502184 RepID=UPI00115DC6ED|nr:type III pantothenate kinase [Tepidiphilus olei]
MNPTLLLDLGNTRLKWALLDGDTWRETGACRHEDIATWVAAMRARLPATIRCFGVNVAHDRLARELERQLGSIHWLVAQAQSCGVTNGYDEPERLGADRWAALIAAHHLHRGAALVVCCGTATTVDWLDADGFFRGGLILPGLTTMRASLAHATARLPFATGDVRLPPTNTHDAIASGCLLAQVGAIEHYYRVMEGPACGAMALLSGGDADIIAGHLAIPARTVDNLVLRGLAVVAAASARPNPSHDAREHTP